MVTKVMIEQAKDSVIKRQDSKCIKCACCIDVSNTSSYCFVSNKGLQDRYKFSDVESLEIYCIQCFRLMLSAKTKKVFDSRRSLQSEFGYKTCINCNKSKSLDNFKKHNTTGRHRNQCSECISLKDTERRLNNIDTYREGQRQKHKRLMIQSESYRNSKRLSSIHANKKKDWSKYNKARSIRINNQRINNLIGQTCDIYCLECYVCKCAVIGKSNKTIRCKSCAEKKIVKCYNLIKYNCLQCGDMYMSTKRSKGICIKCSKKNGNKRPSRREHKDRARQYNVYYENIRAEVIYKRDKYKCCECGCRVFKSKTYRPDQATLDHVIPMSKGGSHTIDNIVTMCHTCNSSKSDRLKSGKQIGLFCKV